MTSPTDLQPEPSCTFCGRARKLCRLLIAAPENKAFICDHCVIETVNTTITHLADYPALEGVTADA